jgi:hypothetical protein
MEQVTGVVGNMVSTISALVSPRSDIKPQHLNGPVGIMRIYYLVFENEHAWRQAFWFSVLLNVNLGLMNLLPIPMLDGGHIVLSLAEFVRRRPLSEPVIRWVQTAGAMLVIGFILYVTTFDLVDLRGGKSAPARQAAEEVRFGPATTPAPTQAPAGASPRPDPRSLRESRVPIPDRQSGSVSDSDFHFPMKYCLSPWSFSRRPTREVSRGRSRPHGGVVIGGTHPVVQPVHAHLRHDGHRRLRAADARSRRRRLPDRPHHRADREGRGEPREHRRANCAPQGCHVPIVADIHFKPEAAMEAVEVGRESPRQSRQLRRLEEIRGQGIHRRGATPPSSTRIEEKFTPLVLEARRLGAALRIGTNHGSLSDRIMNRYGDSPLGMVESALEFARICRKHDFHNFVFSMKSSNPKVMIECYRLLAARLEQEGADWNYPHPPRRDRGRRRRGRPHQVRHRHRLAALRRHRRHHPRFAHRGQPA